MVTALAAAHRLGAGIAVSTHDLGPNLRAAAEADRVLVLDDGRIVDSGSHRDLMARSPLYKHLFELKAAPRLVTTEVW